MLPVVGGSIAAPGAWPDVVAVLGSHGSCTGTLVAPDVVITAGHCSEIDPIEIVADTIDYADGGEHVDVASVAAYPGWQTGFDVAAIVLAHPVASATPRAIATDCALARGEDVQIVGFGMTRTSDPSNTALHQATTQVIDPNCTDTAGCRAMIAPDGELVAGDAAAASCFGDSGGPVIIGDSVVALVSRGVSGDAACSGAIYTRLDKMIGWIEQTTGRTIEKQQAADRQIGGCASSRPDLGALLALLSLARRRRH